MTEGEIRTWPTGRTIPDDEALVATCDACGTRWRVHRNMAGFKFECGNCGAWVRVAQPDSPTPLQLEAAASLQPIGEAETHARLDVATRPVDEMATDEEGLVRLDMPAGVPYRGAISSGTPLAPGSLRYALEDDRQRWTNRTALEIGAMLLAILAPVLAAVLLFTEREVAALLPLTSLVGGVLVILVGLTSPAYTFGGLRAAKPSDYAIAIGAAALLVLAAVGWVGFLEGEFESRGDDLAELRQMLGTPLLLCVTAAAPAIFEELAFRGLLQGRLTALMGLVPGIVATAALFALAHGISAGSPLHISAGLVLGVLRVRSGSLLPGMLLHFLYNGTLVLLGIA
ncbi:MAG: type II CAAX endopeptidase family protein [Planctomycetota bacterium]